MSNVRSMRDAKTASRQASEWLVLLEGGDVTASDRARVDAWRRERPGNQAAFEELKHTWGGSRRWVSTYAEAMSPTPIRT